MKFKTIISRDRDEEVVIYAHERTKEIEKIEAFVAEADTELLGYDENRGICKLVSSEIDCFAAENGRTYALVGSQRLWVKKRLYELEEMLDDSFVKINQSCIGNIQRIRRFDVSVGGALMVTFKNGHRDYVSRRQLKFVKERIGF